MIAGSQRRALATGGDIGGAKIVNDGDASGGGEQAGIAGLPCPAGVWPMRYGVAVKADKAHVFTCCASGGEQPVNGDGVEAGEFGRDSIDQRVGAGPCEFEGAGAGLAEAALEIGIIGDGEKAFWLDMAFTVGEQEGGVDAVARGAGHEA